MMTRSRSTCLFTLAIVVALVTPAAAQDWSGSGRVKGTVTDPDGKPVKDAKVYYRMALEQDQGPEPFVTNKKGRFAFLGLRGGPWLVRIEAEGFETWTTTAEVYSTGVSDQIAAKLIRVPEEILVAQARFKAQARLDKAKALSDQGDMAGAVKEYEAALSDVGEEDYPIILANLGALYLVNGDIANAKATYQRSLDIDGDNVASLKGMVAIVASEGRMDEAEAMLAKIPETEAVHPNTLMNIGMAHYNKGEMDEAKVFLDRTVRDNPETVQVYYFRGLVNLSLDNREQAKADFDKFLELAPDAPQAAEVTEYLGYLNQ